MNSKRTFTVLFLLVAAFAGSGPCAVSKGPPAKQDPLYVLSVSGTIDPAVKDYVREGLLRAGRDGAAGVLVVLDTPGGLLDSTRDIVQSILNAPYPVIVYVSPQGARAASAGVFITLSADVAAMAPLTHLGAAHPVSIGGGGFAPTLPGKETKEGGDVVMEKKTVSDTAAYARSLAADKGRNADWAEKAVRESLSLTAEEALKNHVIDVVAGNRSDLFRALNGREIKKNGKTWRLDFSEDKQIPVDMSALQKFLHAIANPNLAYLLLILGFYALIYEFASPGIGFGGVTGAISLVLAFFALQVLPLNYAGLALLVLGVVLMSVDHVLGGHGILILGGSLCFVLGSFFLFDPGQPFFRVSLALIGGTLAATVGFFLFVIKKIWEIRRLKSLTGAEALVGKVGEVRAGGLVFVNGEYWSVLAEAPLIPGQNVRVSAVEGIKLRVSVIDKEPSKRENF